MSRSTRRLTGSGSDFKWSQKTGPLVREPVIGLIKWLKPKGMKVCSYVEKCAEFKNQTLKKIGWYTKVLCASGYFRGMQ